MYYKNPFLNPEGIVSLSPGLARFRGGAAWVPAFIFGDVFDNRELRTMRLPGEPVDLCFAGYYGELTFPLMPGIFRLSRTGNLRSALGFWVSRRPFAFSGNHFQSPVFDFARRVAAELFCHNVISPVRLIQSERHRASLALDGACASR